MEHTILRRTITDLVDDNYVYAHVLYYFGIRFYEYAEDTLEQACRRRGLNVFQVMHSLEQAHRPDQANLIALESLPVDLVIEYLRHTHATFVKQTLPYMAHLVETLRYESAPCVKDLQLLFPLFVEDFILHIHEEEDTVFQYVHLLQQARQKQVPSGKLFFQLERNSVERFASDHETHDDEMAGIREITNHYTLSKGSSQHLKVVFAELKSFEGQLLTHARVENEILFPKALVLEKEVKAQLQRVALLN